MSSSPKPSSKAQKIKASPSENHNIANTKSKFSLSILLPKLGWIGSSVFLWKFFEFESHLRLIDFQSSFSFWMVCLTGGMFLSICFYLTFYIPKFTNRVIHLSQWERDCPREIQLATLMGFLCFLFLNILMWPFYHILSPIFLFIFMLGGISLVSLF